MNAKQHFQQTASFVPNAANRPWWQEDQDLNEYVKGHDIPLFTQTQGPNMSGRVNGQRVGRHRGARSMSHHYANLSNINGQKTSENTFGNSKLDNKGRTINKENNEQQKFSDQNLFDDLSQAANY